MARCLQNSRSTPELLRRFPSGRSPFAFVEISERWCQRMTPWAHEPDIVRTVVLCVPIHVIDFNRNAPVTECLFAHPHS